MSFNPGGGGGISGASDVALSNPVNDHSLAYNSTTQKWQNKTLSGTVVNHDSLPLSVPGTVTWTGTAWPARSTVTSQATRRIFYVGNPGGAGPTDMQENDIWIQG